MSRFPALQSERLVKTKSDGVLGPCIRRMIRFQTRQPVDAESAIRPEVQAIGELEIGLAAGGLKVETLPLVEHATINRPADRAVEVGAAAIDPQGLRDRQSQAVAIGQHRLLSQAQPGTDAAHAGDVLEQAIATARSQQGAN